MNRKKGWWEKTHCFLTDDKKIDAEISWIRKLWYIILLIISSVHVLKNFKDIIQFEFFSEFNGNNLIFLIWLMLLILPLFDKIEAFGVSYKTRTDKEPKDLTNQLLQNSVGDFNIQNFKDTVNNDLIKMKED